MTAISLPLKKIPGQDMKSLTFFGGRANTAPAVLLFTLPFNIYLYLQLSQGSLLYYNLIGFLPYIWCLVSIIYYIKESGRTMENIFEADFNEAGRIFEESKVNFRMILVSNCFSSIIMMAVFSYLLIAYGMLPLFIIGVSSITSVGITTAAILSRYKVKRVLIYISAVLAFEAVSLFLVLRGHWELGVIFPVVSIVFVYSCLRRVKGYDMRSFFERVIN